MNCYAGFKFTQSPLNSGSYILQESFGKVDGLIFPKYKDIKRNMDAGIAGREYLIFSIPKSPSIRRYFARIFELGNGFTLSGTDELIQRKDVYRTFGDTKKLGTRDLILFEFTTDMKELKVYFIRNMGYSKKQKNECFERWNDGENLSMEK